jgi:hypothetical protein
MVVKMWRRLRVGFYPLVCVETATACETRVGVAPPPPPVRRVRGSHGCQRTARSVVADARPDGAETGVDVQ